MEVDVLVKKASANEMSDQIKIQYIPSIDIPEVLQIDEVSNWTTPIISYLKDGLLPEDKEKVRKSWKNTCLYRIQNIHSGKLIDKLHSQLITCTM